MREFVNTLIYKDFIFKNYLPIHSFLLFRCQIKSLLTELFTKLLTMKRPLNFITS